MRRRQLLVGLAFAASFASFASLPSFAAFEDLGAGARAPGMGNAFTAVADDVYAMFYNPAGLSDLVQPEFSASYSKLFIGLSDGSDLGLSQVAYARPLKNGDWGHMGLAWQRFALSQMYSENSLYLSYSRPAYHRRNLGTLYTGLNLKYLNRGFNTPSEALNAFDNANQATGSPDPLLSGNNSRSALDADLGFLFRTTRHYSFGLMLTHVPQPNVAFGTDKDSLSRGAKLGVGYKSLWTNLSGDLDFTKAPDGGMDKDFIVAGERYFPTLDYGQFGLRGSLGLGSRSFEQLTLGLSYRINKIQLDYAFLMPFGTVKSTLGTHRIALTFHFGAPTAVEEFSSELLENLKKLERTYQDVYAYEFEGLKRLPESDKVVGALIKKNLEEGHYDKAYRYLNELVDVQDTKLTSLKSRLRIVAQNIPDLAEPKLKWEKVLSVGIKDFLNEGDAMAVKRAAYALSLNTQNSDLEKLLKAMEAATGIAGERVSSRWVGKFSLVEEKLLKTESGLQDNRLDDVIKECSDILDLEPDDPTALSRMGTAHYIKGDLVGAVTYWTRAVKFEENSEERKTLYRAIRKAHIQANPAEATPEERQAPAEVPTPGKAAQAPPQQKGMDPRVIEKLYRDAVGKYASGNKDQAATIFQEILDLDPGNAQAQKALDRIHGERP